MRHLRTFTILFLAAGCCLGLFSCSVDSAEKGVDYRLRHTVILPRGDLNRSACITPDGLYVLSDSGEYNVINLLSGEMSAEAFDPELCLGKSTYIAFCGNRFIVSDVGTRSLTFFDRKMQFKKRVVLSNIPIAFKAYGNKCVYLSGLLQKRRYNFVLLKEMLSSHRVRHIFEGGSLDTWLIRDSLDLDKPGTICFDYDGRYVFAADQRYDSYVIHRFKPNRFDATETFIQNVDWQPIRYSEEGRENALRAVEKMLDGSGYPLGQVNLSHKLAIQSLAVDPCGRLWVVSSAPETSISLDVYSNDGAPVEKMSFDGIEKAKIIVSDTHFVLMEMDEEGPRIFIYEIL